MRALILVRDLPHYRRGAFVTGLGRLGFQIVLDDYQFSPRRDDVVVLWNRYGAKQTVAERFEAVGATVLVAENGFAGHEHGQPPKYYALARTAHGGMGQWFVGPEDRWSQLGIELAPWRPETADGHILICPARGFSEGPGRQPATWVDDIKARLRETTKRPIRVRQHPNNKAHPVPLADDLKNCHAVIVWTSSVGVKALVAGVPVFHGAPRWICQQAARRFDHAQIEQPFIGDRFPALNAMAHAQFTVEEIATGEPIRRLLDPGVKKAA